MKLVKKELGDTLLKKIWLSQSFI